MKIIAFTGLPGSGKSTMIDAIEDMGKVITMGDVIRNEAKIQGIDPSDENLGRIAKELRKTHGPNIIAEKCVDLIKSLEDGVIFIDGIRSMAEIETFRKHWKVPVIAADVDKEVRFKRMIERNRSDDPKTIKELEERDNREKLFGVNEVISNADYRLDNTEDIEVIKRRTKEIVIEILKNTP